MTKFAAILILIIISVSIYSCSRDEINVPPEIIIINSKGAYVVSEGGFTPGTSKLSYYNNTEGIFTSSIFNPGNLGLLPDGLFYDNGNLFITEQGNSGAAGKIYKTDTNGTVLMSASAGVNPYSFTIANNKIYLSNGPTNSVSVLNRNSLGLAASDIGVGIYPQEILAVGNNVFVCNTSLFNGGTDSTVSVISAVTDQVISTIQVSRNPTALVVTTDGKLLVGCPGDSTSAVIYKIDPVTFNIIDIYRDHKFGFCKDIVFTSANEIIYIAGDIYAEGSIVKYSLSSRSAVSLIPKPTGGLNYGLNFDSESSNIYVCVAASDFTSNGKFRVYDVSGTLKNEFVIAGGIAPRRIALKK